MCIRDRLKIEGGRIVEVVGGDAKICKEIRRQIEEVKDSDNICLLYTSSQVMDAYEKLYKDMEAGKIISAYAVEGYGAAEAVSKMAFGNRLGVKIEHNVDPRDFFAPGWGNIVCEVPDGKVGELSITYTVIGEVTEKQTFEYGNTVITMEEALHAWTKTLEKVFRCV